MCLVMWGIQNLIHVLLNNMYIPSVTESQEWPGFICVELIGLIGWVYAPQFLGEHCENDPQIMLFPSETEVHKLNNDADQSVQIKPERIQRKVSCCLTLVHFRGHNFFILQTP